jgi:uncharacterized RDD family membrane protein YckC
MEWYYAEAGKRVGPIPDAEFRALRAAGKVAPENLVWRAGMTGWEPAGSLPEWQFATGVPNLRLCTQCGREFAPEDLVRFESARVCAECKDLFFQRLREEGMAAAVKTFNHYGGFWIRVLARVIDGAILWVLFLILMFLWEAAMKHVIFDPTSASAYDLAAVWGGLGLIYLISSAASVAYEAWFLAHRGGTPGKLAVGLRVIRPNGETLTRSRSLGRAFGYLLTSMLPLGIGYIMAGIDEEKRALHDRVCDTRVVYKQ